MISNYVKKRDLLYYDEVSEFMQLSNQNKKQKQHGSPNSRKAIASKALFYLTQYQVLNRSQDSEIKKVQRLVQQALYNTKSSVIPSGGKEPRKLSKIKRSVAAAVLVAPEEQKDGTKVAFENEEIKNKE